MSKAVGFIKKMTNRKMRRLGKKLLDVKKRPTFGWFD